MVPPTAKACLLQRKFIATSLFYATLSRIFLKLCNLCLPEFSQNCTWPDPEPFRKLTRNRREPPCSHRSAFPNRGFVTYHRQPSNVTIARSIHPYLSIFCSSPLVPGFFSHLATNGQSRHAIDPKWPPSPKDFSICFTSHCSASSKVWAFSFGQTGAKLVIKKPFF